MNTLHYARYLFSFLLGLCMTSCWFFEDQKVKTSFINVFAYDGASDESFPLHTTRDLDKKTIPLSTISMYFKTIITNFYSQSGLQVDPSSYENYPTLGTILKFVMNDGTCNGDSIFERYDNNPETLKYNDIFTIVKSFTYNDPYFGKDGEKLKCGYCPFGAGWATMAEDPYGRPAKRWWGGNSYAGARDMFWIVVYSSRMNVDMAIFSSDTLMHRPRGAILNFDAYGSDLVKKFAEPNYYVFAYGAQCVQYDIYSFEPGVYVYVADPEKDPDTNSTVRYLTYSQLSDYQPIAMIYDHGFDIDRKYLNLK